MKSRFPVLLKRIIEHEDFQDLRSGLIEANYFQQALLKEFNQRWEDDETFRDIWEHLVQIEPTTEKGIKHSPFRIHSGKSAKQSIEDYFLKTNEQGQRESGKIKKRNKVLYALYCSAIDKESGRKELYEWEIWEQNNSLSVFTEYDKWMSSSVNIEEENNNSVLNDINGVWRIYIKHESDYFLSLCEINEDQTAKYISIHKNDNEGHATMTGKVLLSNNSGFQLKFWNRTKTREFVIFNRRDQKMTEGILPGFGLVYEGRRIRSLPIMMWKSDNEKILKSIPKGFKPEITVAPSNQKEEQILSYLSHYSHQITHHLPTDSIEKVNLMLFREAGRNHYAVLKQILGKKKWVSITRILNSSEKISLYTWDFSFDDKSNACMVQRVSYRDGVKLNYHGEAKVFDDHFWIELHEKSSKKQKFFFCQRETIANDDFGIIAPGFSSAIFGADGKHVVKELLFSSERLAECSLQVDNNNIQYLTYSDFRDKLRLPLKFKIAFAQRDSALLNFQDPNNKLTRASRQFEASKFSAKYLIYLVNMYDKSKLFKCTFEIDALGTCTLIKDYNDGLNEVVYQGVAEYLDETLRIVLEHKPARVEFMREEDKRQFAEVLLSCKDRKNRLFLGILSDTDIFQFPHSSSIIAVKYDEIHTIDSSLIFEPGQIDFDQSLEELAALWQIMDQDLTPFFKSELSKKGNCEVDSLEDFFNIYSNIELHDYSRKFLRK